MARDNHQSREVIARLTERGQNIAPNRYNELKREGLIPRLDRGAPITEDYLAHVSRANELRSHRVKRGVAIRLRIEGHPVPDDVVRNDIASHLRPEKNQRRDDYDGTLSDWNEKFASKRGLVQTLTNNRGTPENVRNLIRDVAENDRITHESLDTDSKPHERVGQAIINIESLTAKMQDRDILSETVRSLVWDATDDEIEYVEQIDLTSEKALRTLAGNDLRLILNITKFFVLFGRAESVYAPTEPAAEALNAAVWALIFLGNIEVMGRVFQPYFTELYRNLPS